jgi:hypothetical protein
MNKQHRRRAFMLLEVLLAIAILGMCAYPLLAPHIKIAQFEIESLEMRMLERYADQTFIEIVESLYENKMPGGGDFSPLTTKNFQKGTQAGRLEPIQISIGQNRKCFFQRNFQIENVNGAETTSEAKSNESKNGLSLLSIQIAFIKEGKNDPFAEYAYRVIVEEEKQMQETSSALD